MLMLDWLLTYNTAIREVLNGSLFPLSFFLAFLIIRFLVVIYLETGRSFAAWRKADGAQTACVFAWFLLAEGTKSFWVWFTYRTDNLHVNIAATPVGTWSALWFILANVALLIVILRATYLFTPENVWWREWAWKVSFGTTFIFNVGSVMTDRLGII